MSFSTDGRRSQQGGGYSQMLNVVINKGFKKQFSILDRSTDFLNFWQVCYGRCAQ